MSDMEQSADVQNSEAQEEVVPQDIENEVETDSESDSQEQPEEEEQDEIEVDGAKFALPKTAAEKLKAERMMHADYTRKTQEVAEERRALAAEREKQAADTQAEFADRARLHNVADLLKQYEQVDWQAAWDTDPVAAGKAQAQINALMNEKARLENGIAQKQHERALNEQQATAKQVQEAEAYVAREIPGWTQQRGEELKNFATAQGIEMTPEIAKVLIKAPAFLKIMHKAELFDKLEKKQTAKAPQPAATVKPVTRVTAKASIGQVDPNKLSADEWRTWREQQLAQQRKR